MNTMLACLQTQNGATIGLVDGAGVLRWRSDQAELEADANQLVPLDQIPPSGGNPVVWAIRQLERWHDGSTTTVFGELLEPDRFYGVRPGDVLESRAPTAAEVAAAARAADRRPTPGQEAAGNYRMGHVRIQGLAITIENAKGSKRSGTTREGETWTVTMAAHYGYLLRTESPHDSDHIDCFIGPDPASEIVFVIDQLNRAGEYDEAKCMIGWTNAADAKAAYLANYGPGWTGFGGMCAKTMVDFKAWLDQQRPRPLNWLERQPWFHRG